MVRVTLGLGVVLGVVALSAVRRGDVGGVGPMHFVLPAALLLWLTASWLALLGRAARDRLDLGLLGVAVVARAAVLPARPNLSDDFWRYAWDGHLVARGVDPFAATPRAVWEGLGTEAQTRLGELWLHLNSQAWPSVYPPLPQAIFGVGAWAWPDTWRGTVLALKLTLLLADVGAILLLDRLALRWGLDRRAAWIYGLCPLVLVEHAANAHLEGLVPVGLLAGLLLLDRGHGIAGALAFGLGAAAKLNPLLLLPALARRLGARAPRVVALVLAVTVGPFFLLTDAEGLVRVGEGLRLYVRLFEFNSGLHALAALAIGRSAGVVLAGVALVGVLLLAVRDRRTDLASFPDAAVAALGLYWLTATTIHPWYLTPLVALASLGSWRWPLVWASLIPFTYVAYWLPDLHPPGVLVAAEHGVVLAVLAGELAVRAAHRRDPRRWPGVGWAFRASLPSRLRIKRALVDPWLGSARSVLDLGSGAGWLASALVAEGRVVTAVDVQDRHEDGGLAPQVVSGPLPFDADRFDLVLLVTVLHHADDAEAVLAEAARVAPRLVVVEDVPEGAAWTAVTALVDRLANLDLTGPPPRFRTEAAWRDAFHRAGLRVEGVSRRRTLGVFRQAAFALVREEVGAIPPSGEAPPSR